MRIKSDNPKMMQKEIAKELGYSDSTLSRHRKDIDMTSPYKSTNSHHKNKQDCQNTSKYVKIRHGQVPKRIKDENHQNMVKNNQKQHKTGKNLK